jgi:hypothetical protein
MFSCNFAVVLVVPSECQLLLCSSRPTTHRGLWPRGSMLARMFTTSPRTSTWRSQAPSLLSHSLIHCPSVHPLSISFLLTCSRAEHRRRSVLHRATAHPKPSAAVTSASSSSAQGTARHPMRRCLGRAAACNPGCQSCHH